MPPQNDKNTKPITANGHTLLVGEGDFSFAKNLAEQTAANARSQILATCYEPLWQQVTKKKQANIQALQEMGVVVRGGVDATALSKTIGIFDTIIWNFPHKGKIPRRKSILEHQKLLFYFFASASSVMSQGGKVYVTVRNRQPYTRSWNIPKQAREHGFDLIDTKVLEIEELKAAYPSYVPIKTIDGKAIPTGEVIIYIFQLGGTSKS